MSFESTVKRKFTIGLSIMALLAVPITVMAQSTDDTEINVELDSSISLTAGGAVNLNIMPAVGGAQSSGSDTVTVSTNNITGYTLTLENDDLTTALDSGTDTIAAHTGTHGSPTALANNSWGYALPGAPFDVSYTPPLSSAPSSSSLWAGVPAAGSAVTLKTTSDTASGDVTTIWYSAKADTTKDNGTYTDTVTYSATTNP